MSTTVLAWAGVVMIISVAGFAAALYQGASRLEKQILMEKREARKANET